MEFKIYSSTVCSMVEMKGINLLCRKSVNEGINPETSRFCVVELRIASDFLFLMSSV